MLIAQFGNTLPEVILIVSAKVFFRFSSFYIYLFVDCQIQKYRRIGSAVAFEDFHISPLFFSVLRSQLSFANSLFFIISMYALTILFLNYLHLNNFSVSMSFSFLFYTQTEYIMCRIKRPILVRIHLR